MTQQYILEVHDSSQRYRIREELETSFSNMDKYGYPSLGIVPLTYNNTPGWFINFDSEENMNKFMLKYL